MTTLTIQVPDKDTELLKQVLKKFNAKILTEESPYNEEFVNEIKKGERDLKSGKGIKVDVGSLWK